MLDRFGYGIFHASGFDWFEAFDMPACRSADI
jgi:hypothetical protein